MPSSSAPLPSYRDKYSLLRFSQRARILTVTIAHAESYNAVDAQLHHEFSTIFRDLNRDTTIDVIILTGERGWFSAGGDMDWFQTMIDSPSTWTQMIIEAKQIITDLLMLEKPIICKLNGTAAGFGASVALLCDVVFASDTVKLGDPHVSAGLVAGDGGALIWPLLIGLNRAKEFLFTGTMLTSEDAYRYGLVNHLCSNEELDATVDQFANKIANGHQGAIRGTKVALNQILLHLHLLISPYALAQETIVQSSPSHQAAVNTFRARHTNN